MPPLPSQAEIEHWIADVGQTGSVGAGMYTLNVPSSKYSGEHRQLIYDPKTGGMWDVHGPTSLTRTEYDMFVNKLLNADYQVMRQSPDLPTGYALSAPTEEEIAVGPMAAPLAQEDISPEEWTALQGGSPQERWAKRVAGRETAGLLGALESERAALEPGVRREAFSPHAARGFGLSGMAEGGVGEAVGELGTAFERKKQQAKTTGLKTALEQIQMREPVFVPEAWQAV